MFVIIFMHACLFINRLYLLIKGALKHGYGNLFHEDGSLTKGTWHEGDLVIVDESVSAISMMLDKIMSRK